MDDIDKSMSILRELHEIGVQLAIDDFGIGYSSLSYLKRLPIDAVKIDKSFVRGMVEDSDGARLVAAFVSLARDLGLRSVAEGVESEQELGALRSMSCDEFQGFLRGRPMLAQELLQIGQSLRPTVSA